MRGLADLKFGHYMEASQSGDCLLNQRRRGGGEIGEGYLVGGESCVAGRSVATDEMVVAEMGMVAAGEMRGELEFEGDAARRNC